MSNASHGDKRGGIAALRAASGLSQSLNRSHSSFNQTFSPPTDSQFRQPFFAAEQTHDLNLASQHSHVHDFASIPSQNDTTGNLDFSDTNGLAQEELLQDAVFPDWRDDAAPEDFDDPDEMQKKDPLGTQIWKLYSRTKTRLPNQERMENLTWRMMAMNLRRREQQAAYVMHTVSLVLILTCDQTCGSTSRERCSRESTGIPCSTCDECTKVTTKWHCSITEDECDHC